MASLAIIGAQWGDEGKGKIADLLASKCDYVVRYQGGNNAGHTIVVGDKKVVLHLIPSGILHDRCISVIAHGVVFDPRAFLDELEHIKRLGVAITAEKLKISSNCFVITSYDRLLDIERERAETLNIGTTRKGIGPAYEDKVARRGIRLRDLYDKKTLLEKLKFKIEEKKILFDHLYKVDYPDIGQEAEKLFGAAKIIAPFLANTFDDLGDAVRQNKNILYEGAQGVLLDIDYGSYPYVTSSHTSVGGIYTGAVPFGGHVGEILGIAKAYTTRVGRGPFPTELLDDTGERIQRAGNEFGATTGRKRRCGWIDLPLLKYATKASGITSFALTKMDVLRNVEPLRICYAYNYGGRIVDSVCPEMDISKAVPLFREMAPFDDEFQEGQNFSPELTAYVEAIEESTGCKIGILSYGSERNQIRFLKDYRFMR